MPAAGEYSSAAGVSVTVNLEGPVAVADVVGLNTTWAEVASESA
jgi:ribosomal protein S28E/S33